MPNRDLPYSPESENALLGNIMTFPKAMEEAVNADLQSEDFYNKSNALIFRIMRSMYDEHIPVDSVGLISRLNDLGKLDEVGGTNYITELIDASISNVFSEGYIKTIKAKSSARQIIKACEEIAEESYGDVSDVTSYLASIDERIAKITKEKSVSQFHEGKELFPATVHKIQEYAERKPGELTGLKTNYSDIDKKTNGLQKSDLIILAARPSMGKTALALNLAMNAAQTSTGKIAIFSLEMPAEQLAMRMISAKSRVESQKLRTGKLSESEWSRVNRAVQELSAQQFYIDDKSGMKVPEMAAKCRKLNAEGDLSLIVIDYIQLIMGGGSFESRQVEVSEISRRLKALARELNVPVIALSQLSRSVEQRTDKRPMLSDLRESGALEQDADLVMLMYRDSYYNHDEEDEDNNERDDVEVNLAKHRNGPVGTIKLAFLKQYGAFVTIEGENQ